MCSTSWRGCEDTLAWHFDRRGLFTVKSAYHVLDDEKERLQTRQRGQSSSDSSSMDQTGTFWRKLWKSSWCPPRVKHFMWRMAQNSLHLKMNIQTRGVKLDTRCPVCNRLDEDGGHCFLKCKFVRRCWLELRLESARQRLLLRPSTMEFAQELLLLKEDERLKTTIFLWKWWCARNKIK